MLFLLRDIVGGHLDDLHVVPVLTVRLNEGAVDQQQAARAQHALEFVYRGVVEREHDVGGAGAAVGAGDLLVAYLDVAVGGAASHF